MYTCHISMGHTFKFPRNKRKQNRNKSLVQLRHVLFCFFPSSTINDQTDHEEAQTMLHTTTVHLHTQAERVLVSQEKHVYWRVKKIKKKNLQNSKFSVFWKSGLIPYSLMSQGDEIRAYRYGHYWCISRYHGRIYYPSGSTACVYYS